jgi:hypothetical protein
MLLRLLRSLGLARTAGDSPPQGGYVIGKIADLARHHRDAVGSDDPRAGLFVYHDLRRQEEEAWRAADPEKSLASADPTALDEMKNQLAALDGAYSSAELASVDFVDLPLSLGDAAAARLCESYRSTDELGRSFLRSAIDSDRGWALVTFCKRTAVRAGRERRADWLSESLTAQALEGLAAGDVRDNLVALGLVYHCAQRIGADTKSLFADAASISGPAMARVLTDFAARDDLDGILAAMGWSEVSAGDGIGYRWRLE